MAASAPDGDTRVERRQGLRDTDGVGSSFPSSDWLWATERRTAECVNGTPAPAMDTQNTSIRLVRIHGAPSRFWIENGNRRRTAFAGTDTSKRGASAGRGRARSPQSILRRTPNPRRGDSEAGVDSWARDRGLLTRDHTCNVPDARGRVVGVTSVKRSFDAFGFTNVNVAFEMPGGVSRSRHPERSEASRPGRSNAQVGRVLSSLKDFHYGEVRVRNVHVRRTGLRSGSVRR